MIAVSTLSRVPFWRSVLSAGINKGSYTENLDILLSTGGLYQTATKMDNLTLCFYWSPSFIYSRHQDYHTVYASSQINLFSEEIYKNWFQDLPGHMHCSWSAVEILYYLWQKMPFLSVILCYTLSQQPVREERICTRSLTVLSCLASFQYFCWAGWKKNIHGRKGSVSRTGRKLHPGAEKALSDVVFSLLWSQEIHGPFQARTLPT